MVARRPNSKRNLDMALRRMGGADEEFVRRRTLVANTIVGNLMPPGAVKGVEWETLYAAQRGSLDVLPDVDPAVEWANALIAKIAGSR